MISIRKVIVFVFISCSVVFSAESDGIFFFFKFQNNSSNVDPINGTLDIYQSENSVTSISGEYSRLNLVGASVYLRHGKKAVLLKGYLHQSLKYLIAEVCFFGFSLISISTTSELTSDQEVINKLSAIYLKD